MAHPGNSEKIEDVCSPSDYNATRTPKTQKSL